MQDIVFFYDYYFIQGGAYIEILKCRERYVQIKVAVMFQFRLIKLWK